MKFYLEPLGCAKNQVDAETIIAHLDAAGAEFVENPDEAALIIVNSCGFIEEAKREAIDTVISFRNNYPDKKIILSGCLAMRYEKELSRELREADAVFGGGNLENIAPLAFSIMNDAGDTPRHDHPEAVAESAASTPATAAVPDNPTSTPATAAVLSAAAKRTKLFSLPGSAYVKIAEGCNNRCSFCAIPLIRGGLRSRNVEEITDECRAMLERGTLELCLVAQDLASYGKDNGGTLAALLKSLSTLKGSFWVRLLYLHPDHFPFEILEIIAADKRFLPYFDIPFQHASPSLLRTMNRRGGAEAYLKLIEHIRAALPESVIRSTFLTGFPGETESDFDILLDFQNAARIDWLGVFTFSREEGVPAYSLKSRVPKKIARERKKLLETRQTPITEGRMERFTKRRMTALVEERVDSFYIGRLFCHAPEVDGAVVIEGADELPLGSFIDGVVSSRAGFDLTMQFRSAFPTKM
ncbi:MAG: 30S ribosomal protein S12 methylthiotransferase RimO [Spirochaetaceae bacterium]|jgi:ribosomal protein S12 methylthiotransferase|nr:30S ribosomal protein S12 methylthiotransferase RimO [Spirochaetaceae bacterium]